MEKLVNRNESILNVKDLKVSYHTYAGEVEKVSQLEQSCR